MLCFFVEYLNLKHDSFASRIISILSSSSEFTAAKTGNSCVAFVLVLAGICPASVVFCPAAKHI